MPQAITISFMHVVIFLRYISSYSGVFCINIIVYIFPVDPPEIIMPPENITVLPNHTCNLICLSSSFGTLTYDWSKQDGSVSQTAVKSYVHKTVINPLGNVATIVNNLAIYGAQVSDEGWYCCTATNEGGSTTECAWLEVNS